MQSLLMGMLSGASACVLAPIFLPLPKPVAIASLVSGCGLGLGLAAMAQSFKGQEAIDKAEHEQLLNILRHQMAGEQAANEAIAREVAMLDYRYWVETNLAPQEQVAALARMGMKPSWQMVPQAVTTTAVEVRQPEPVAIGGGIVPTTPAPVQQYFDDRDYWAEPEAEPILEVSDVAQMMALYDGHVLVASKTGSGKTTLVQAAIAKAHDHYQGMIDFFIIDPKGASWLGLEHDADYAFVARDDKLHLATSMIDKLVKVLQSRQQQRMSQGGHWYDGAPMPVVLIIDECNSLYSRLKSLNKSQAENFARAVQLIIFQGREDNVHVWLFAQTTRVEQLGLNTSVQDNMSVIALARNGNYESIEDALGNRYMIGSTTTKKRLTADYEQYKSSTPDIAIPIAVITNNGGEMVQLPDYSQYRNVRLERKAQNQSTDEILGLDEAPDTRWIIDQVRDVLQGMGTPTELLYIKAAYQAITQKQIDDQGAELIRRELLR